MSTPSWWKTSGDGLDLTLVVPFRRRLPRRRFLINSRAAKEPGHVPPETVSALSEPVGPPTSRSPSLTVSLPEPP